jgi:hypothetical protein
MVRNRRCPKRLSAAVSKAGVVGLVGFFVIATVLLLPTTVRLHPAIGPVLSPLLIWAYSKFRNGVYGGEGFGPLWLELIDVYIILGNAGAFVVGCILAVRRLL